MARSPDRGDVPLPDGVLPVETPLQAILDRLTALAARVLRVPVVLLTFIEADRQIVRSRSVYAGPLTDVYETPLSDSLCRQVTAGREAIVIADTRDDPRTCDNPTITDLHVVAYAGVPFFDGRDRALGAFCAIDHEARAWRDEEIETLRMLAAQVTGEIVLRDALEATASGKKAGRADRLDVRAPLRTMLLGMQAIRRLGKLNDQQAGCLALIEREGRVLVAIMDKRLDARKRRRGGRGANDE